MQRTVELSEEQARELERVAAEERRSLNQLVNVAIRDYLERRRVQSSWTDRFREIVEEVRAGVPPDATPEEIEADIRTALAEYRAEHPPFRNS